MACKVCFKPSLFPLGTLAPDSPGNKKNPTNLQPNTETEVEEYLRRKLEGVVKKTERIEKEDLKLPNHLIGLKRRLIRLSFHNVPDLLTARKVLMPIVEENQRRHETADTYAEISLSSALTGDMDTLNGGNEARNGKQRDASTAILDVLEYDVPYHVRVAIDLDIRVGKWYTVEAKAGRVELACIEERVARADPVVMAYDIETTKSPLKFPDAAVDKIMMISYMIDGQGYLITNREIVSQDIEDFEYTPKPEYEGNFVIFNEDDEVALLHRFFEHIRDEKPTVIATFNGDFFDWPFVEARAAVHGLDMYDEIGFQKDSEGEYKSAHCVHMDCFRWVKRDSYLPQGSQGLKSVTTAKLGYNPIEIDPELMTPYAREKPQVMAEYSVSDAVATYYLYMKYVHPFIFSLCTIIPLNPDEVLRKGTGTLCEMLLMVQAYKKDIVLPHKHKDPPERFYNGHLIESETYVGGHVESLEAGVFRSDIPTDFTVDPTAIDELLRDLDAALKFTVEVEAKMDFGKVSNYAEVRDKIAAMLTALKEQPVRHEEPRIYHVDVASMYPNIMTTNRLQPDSMISEEDCASCDFNRPGKTCDRRLPWSWRGEYYPPKRDEYFMLKNALKNQKFAPKFPGQPMRSFDELTQTEQAAAVKKSVAAYSRKVYHKIKESETVEREAIICQRENPFYVNTVRDFRDRRYEFKGLQKVWKKNLEKVPAHDAASREEAKKMVVLYDSLQLAHKVILNSFYGYVMRKGSRWYSMEMAGVTCLTGATIIQLARSLVERLGRPLELDTDGIWCILPSSFPEDFVFTFSDGKKLPVSYPCVMMNHLVHAKFTNHQYQTLVDPATLTYETKSDNSIFFEVDGPYKAMILPTSKEEDKGLKKRYAVFNDDGSLAELKGFELKRRGELRLIKAFQGQIFSVFLDGKTLEECYASVAKVANSWLDILETKGRTLEEDDLIDLISENRSMSKTLAEYAGQKSTSICTARRLAEFLGEQMVKDAGLACKYIISKKPLNAPVTDRAVPVQIFSADVAIKSHYLRKWLREPGLDNFDPRNIIDWEYYWERLASTIQKIITIPAGLQKVANPVPRVPHPDWLSRRVAASTSKFKQQKVTDVFAASETAPKLEAPKPMDIEDFGSGSGSGGSATAPKVARVSKRKQRNATSGTNRVSNIEELQEQLQALETDAVSPSEDYGAWLKHAKVRWSLQKQLRRHREHLFGESSTTSRASSGLTSLMRNQTEANYSKAWHILSLVPELNPGEVRATALVNGKIQNLKVVVPRTIYVDYAAGHGPGRVPKGGVVERSSAVLPGGKTSPGLYRVTMPEAVYQAEIHRADSMLKDCHVAGVYESKIEAHERAMLYLGNCCTLDSSRPGLLGRGLEHGFELDWLIPSKEPYLGGSTHLEYVFLLHIVAGDYQVYALVPTWASEAHVFVLRPGSSRSSEGLGGLSKVYADQLANVPAEVLSEFEDIIAYQPAMAFSEAAYDNPRRLYQKMGSVLARLHAERGSQAVLCVQSPQPSRLKKLVRAINDFPTLELSNPGGTTLPAVGWQTACSKLIVKSYLRLAPQLRTLKDLAVYGNMPLGSLKGDDARAVIDTLYARRLADAGIVLWWSPNPIPDSGGAEKDDSMVVAAESTDLPVVNNPGLYHKACIELELRNLSVNTILTAAIINEAEGADLAGQQLEDVVAKENQKTAERADTDTAQMVATAGSAPFVQNAFSTPALSALSGLVKQWWNEAAYESNAVADRIVQGFVCWASSPDAALFDRVLYYHVQNLSRKAFVQLIREVRRLGTSVVFADQGRILLQTTKAHVDNTYAFAKFVVKSLRSKPLFAFLDVQVTQYWDVLLWMDQYNYCGRGCREIRENATEYSTVLAWQLKQFLPELLQSEFEDWVVHFLEKLVDRKAESPVVGEPGRLTQIPSTQLNRVANPDDADAAPPFGSGIFQDMDKPLVNRVKQLVRRYHEGLANPDIGEQFKLPSLPSTISISATNTTNAVTLFVKALCGVFALARDLGIEFRILRRRLLHAVGLAEFSDEANFRNPSLSLRLANVTCQHCGFVRDIDLLRDDYLLVQSGPAGIRNWVCESCGEEYSRLTVEERLIQDIHKLVAVYQVQDLRCTKCRRIRDDDMSQHCDCSGTWAETVPRSSVDKSLSAYSQAADFFDLRLVRGVLDAL